jgi:pimeloyl-ACP methyl ester carboxylesterase
MTAFARVGFHAIAPDQRGYGLSDKPQAVSAYALDALVEDVVELIDSTGYQRAAIVGHDWGGIVAWRLAMQHPERVRRLAVLNAPHPLAFREGIWRNPAQLLRSWYTFFFQFPKLPELMLQNQNWKTTRRIFKTHRLGAYSDADLADYRNGWLRPGAATAMINWYRAAMQYPADFSGDCHIHVPTLIVWGDHDEYLSPKLATSSLRYCNNGRLIHQESATHWVHRENPREINRLLKSFLAIEGGGLAAPTTQKKSAITEETTLYK